MFGPTGWGIYLCIYAYTHQSVNVTQNISLQCDVWHQRNDVKWKTSIAVLEKYQNILLGSITIFLQLFYISHIGYISFTVGYRFTNDNITPSTTSGMFWTWNIYTYQLQQWCFQNVSDFSCTYNYCMYTIESIIQDSFQSHILI